MSHWFTSLTFQESVPFLQPAGGQETDDPHCEVPEKANSATTTENWLVTLTLQSASL